METVRAFVGCLLDLGTTRRVAELQRALRKNLESNGWRASWVPPPNLHVTLKFLGDLDIGLVDPLGDALAHVARRHGALRLGVKGIGAFPTHGAPRVLFAEFASGQEKLAALADSVDKELHELGLPREARAFHGHVTLARVKHAPTGGSQLVDLVPPPVLLDCGTGYVADLTLYRSDLLRQGSEYHVLARHPLSGPT